MSNRLFIWLFAAVVILPTSLPSFASSAGSQKPLPAGIGSMGFKVPSQLTARMPIPNDIKNFLDRDFRSRYPVASPLRIDVLQADVQSYTVWNVVNGYGGFDQRHSFRVLVYHADRTQVTVDINVYERSMFEIDQDPILLETFRIVNVWR